MLEKNSKILLDNISVNDVLLTPQKGILDSREDARLSPFLLSSPMDTVSGVELAITLNGSYAQPVLSRTLSDEELKQCFKSNLPDAFYAIGSKYSDLEHFFSLWREVFEDISEQRKVNLCIDVAHGCTNHMLEFYKFIRKNHPNVDKLMCGTIATGSAAKLVSDAGCDVIRVGIGPGCFVPTTKIVAKNDSINIGEVRIGDFVMTHDNRHMPVTNIMTYDVDEYLIDINGTLSTPDHKYFAVHQLKAALVTNENLHLYAEWIAADELTSEWFIIQNE